MNGKQSITIGHFQRGCAFDVAGAWLSVVIDYDSDRVYFELQRKWPEGRLSNARISTPKEARDYWSAITGEIENGN